VLVPRKGAKVRRHVDVPPRALRWQPPRACCGLRRTLDPVTICHAVDDDDDTAVALCAAFAVRGGVWARVIQRPL